MRSGWEKRKLSEICEVVNGGTPKTGVREYWNGNHLWITPAEMGKLPSPYVSDTERKITDLGLRESSAQLLPPNSVILSSRAPIGHLVINTKPMATNQGCKGLIPGTRLNYKFLYFFLLNTVDLLNELGTGATFKELSASKLKEITVPFPSLLEQQRLVSILDDALACIATVKANTQKNLQNASALFEGYLQAVFAEQREEWSQRPLRDLCDIRHGFAFKSNFFTNEGDYILLTPGNFHEKGGYRQRGEKQKYYCGKIPTEYLLSEGDLLIAMTEQAPGLLGSPILIPDSGKFLHNQRLGLVTKKPNVPWINEFFFHVFNTSSVREAIHATASGVKVRHTSPKKIGDVIVAFPTSAKVQRKFVDDLAKLGEDTERLAAICQKKIAALDELKKSLLHQAFSGQL